MSSAKTSDEKSRAKQKEDCQKGHAFDCGSQQREQRSGIMLGVEYRDRCDNGSETKQRGNDETQDEPDMSHRDEVYENKISYGHCR